VIDLQKTLHIGVVLMFAVAGGGSLLDGLRYVWHPWEVPVRYFRPELDILEGILFIAVAFGLLRFDSRVRILAIFITGLFELALGASMVIAPGVVPGVWFLGWLLVLAWLFSGTARAQFHVGKPSQTTA
jgi:hypothetical protein